MNFYLANCYEHWECTKLNWWFRTELKKATLMPQFDMVMLDDVHVFTSPWEPPWKSHYDLESCLQCTTQLLRTLSGSQSTYLNQHSECDSPWALSSSTVQCVLLLDRRKWQSCDWIVRALQKMSPKTVSTHIYF